MSKKLLERTAKKLLIADESKLMRYLGYYAGEIQREHDPDQPGKEALTPTEQQMLAKYERVYELFDVGRPDYMIRQVLMKNYEVKERQAYEIVAEAYLLYGVTGEASKAGKVQASVNFFKTVATVAFKEKNFEAAIRARKEADDLEKLNEKEEAGLDVEEFRKPAKYVFINNVNVYKNAQKELDPDD